MKRKRQTHSAVALGIMAVFGLSSCIYESGSDDRFYRTLWECDEVPLGPFQADDTLFLRWRIENSVYPFTTPMHRLTSYE